MAFNYLMKIVVLVGVIGVSMGGIVPAAPIVAAPAAVGYAKAVPYNVPPFASRVDINTRALAAPLVAAPAAPVVAAPAAPIVAPTAPIVAPAAYSAPILPAAYPAPVVPGPFSAPIVPGPFSAPILAAPGVVGTTYAGSLAAPFAHYAAAAYGPAVLG